MVVARFGVTTTARREGGRVLRRHDHKAAAARAAQGLRQCAMALSLATSYQQQLLTNVSQQIRRQHIAF